VNWKVILKPVFILLVLFPIKVPLIKELERILISLLLLHDVRFDAVLLLTLEVMLTGTEK
jgi:hypothetical protein